MATQTLDAREVMGLLAHRYPLLLVDRIEVLEAGRRVRGIKRVTAGEWATRAGGAMPGLVVVEALAQASAGILLGILEGAAGSVGYFVGMQRVRLRAAARAGDTLALDVELRSFRRGIARLRGTATLDDGRLVASAEFMTVVRPAP